MLATSCSAFFRLVMGDDRNKLEYESFVALVKKFCDLPLFSFSNRVTKIRNVQKNCTRFKCNFTEHTMSDIEVNCVSNFVPEYSLVQYLSNNRMTKHYCGRLLLLPRFLKGRIAIEI